MAENDEIIDQEVDPQVDQLANIFNRIQIDNRTISTNEALDSQILECRNVEYQNELVNLN